MRRPQYLPLPGVSTRDPNFYAGADYGDHTRFAIPVNTTRVDGGVIDIGLDRNATLGLVGIPTPEDGDFTQRPDPSPFKIGARR